MAAMAQVVLVRQLAAANSQPPSGREGSRGGAQLGISNKESWRKSGAHKGACRAWGQNVHKVTAQQQEDLVQLPVRQSCDNNNSSSRIPSCHNHRHM